MRRKRELIKRVDHSGEYHQQSHGTGMGLGNGNSTRGVHDHLVSSPDQIFIAADELHYRYTKAYHFGTSLMVMMHRDRGAMLKVGEN